MKIKCLIVDDEPLARNLLQAYVEKLPFLELMTTCSTAMEAIDTLKRHQPDLLFLDIQMPELTGIALLKSMHHRPLVIFTTAYSEYALESYELDVIDYLLKPITFERFVKAVDKAAGRLSALAPTVPADGPREGASEFLFVKDGNKLVKIRWRDMLYIEGLKDYVVIHTRDQKIVTLQRLKVLESQLPADKFFRIHNSYIVSLEGIDVVHKNEVQIGKVLLPVSETYKKNFRDFLDRNFLT